MSLLLRQTEKILVSHRALSDDTLAICRIAHVDVFGMIDIIRLLENLFLRLRTKGNGSRRSLFLSIGRNCSLHLRFSDAGKKSLNRDDDFLFSLSWVVCRVGSVTTVFGFVGRSAGSTIGVWCASLSLVNVSSQAGSGSGVSGVLNSN